MPLRTLLATLALAALVAPASAQQFLTTTYGPFTVNSTSGTQLSNQLYSVNVNTAGVLRVKYNASPGHCSDVRTHILVDGVVRGVTPYLQPGQSSDFVDVGPVNAGTRVVALQGEGKVGGCNTGVLAAWAGTMDVTTSVARALPPEAVPGPGLLATMLAFALGAFLLGPWRRRRS